MKHLLLSRDLLRKLNKLHKSNNSVNTFNGVLKHKGVLVIICSDYHLFYRSDKMSKLKNLSNRFIKQTQWEYQYPAVVKTAMGRLNGVNIIAEK